MRQIYLISIVSMIAFLALPFEVVAAKTTAPASHAGVLFIVAAVIGGLIALLGIAIAFRSSGGNADVSATLPSGGSIKLRGVGQ